VAAADPVFRRIVVPVDFSPPAERAWALARRMARTTGARLVLVHVFVEAQLYREGPFTMDHVRQVYADARQWASDRLDAWGTEGRGEGLDVETQFREGLAHEQIVAAITETGADLVVMGTEGRGGIGRVLLGSTADRVIRLAPCPVLAVRDSA
jgi:universal stress protein A